MDTDYDDDDDNDCNCACEDGKKPGASVRTTTGYFERGVVQ